VSPGQNSGADSLRSILDSVFSAPDYRWVERPHPFAFLLRGWQWLMDWLAREQGRHPDLFWLLFWLLIAVLVAILVHGVWVMARTIRAAGAPPSAAAPAPEARGAPWYRREAARLARLGRFPEAMQAEFLAVVLELDRRGIVRFHPSKTPAEYAREARLDEPAREGLRGLVRSLYGYAFAGQPCDREAFEVWQASAEQYAGAH